MNKLINIHKNYSLINKPKAILLDWDNTLADSWKIIHKSLNVAFRDLGFEEWTLEDVIKGKGGIHHSMRESFPTIFGEKWEQAKNLYYSAFLSCHLQEISLLSGAIETIKLLAKTNAFIAIVSNKTGIHLRNELNHLGISKYFNAIIGATDAEKDKPNKEPLLLALKHSSITEQDFDKVWMVGDSVTDIEAAFNTGVVPVLYGFADVDSHLNNGDIYQISSHEEFQNIIKNLFFN